MMNSSSMPYLYNETQVLRDGPPELCSMLVLWNTDQINDFACYQPAEVMMAVTCRTCGYRVFPLCMADIDTLFDAVELDEDFGWGRVYCTEVSQRHEILAVLTVSRRSDIAPTEDADQGS